MKLTKMDLKAVEDNNSIYLLDKGSNCLNVDNFKDGIEYYRLSATLGNDIAMSNLGYLYLYGKEVEKNEELAYAYFMNASKKDNVEAIIKLGEFYKKGIVVDKDMELCLYYFSKAIELIKGKEELELAYPEVYLTVGREHMNGGKLEHNSLIAFDYILTARDGYDAMIDNGEDVDAKTLKEIEKLIDNKEFDEIIEAMASHACDCGCEDDCSCGEEEHHCCGHCHEED